MSTQETLPARLVACAIVTATVAETERLVIRAWTHSESDLDRLFDTYSRFEVVQYLGSYPKPMESRDQAPAAVDRWAARCTPDGRYGVWAVQVKQTGVIAGTVLLVPLPDETDVVEVGWHFHPDSWGQGLATEAGRGAIGWGFDRGLEEILAVVRPDNAASIAVCGRLGMEPLGRTDRYYGTELELFRSRATDLTRPGG
jgi:RimJ/RimL family protein N-acetyltransferase